MAYLLATSVVINIFLAYYSGTLTGILSQIEETLNNYEENHVEK